MKIPVPTALTQLAGTGSLAAQANAPTILFGAGIIGVVGGTVLACRATLKLSDTLNNTAHDLAVARQIPDEKYEEADERRGKDIAIIYGKTALEVTKLYAPSIIVGSLAIAALTKSHNILSERNAALAAAYAVVDQAFDRYREKVVDRFGEDVDRELRYEVEEVEITNPKTGKKQTVHRPAPGEQSMYAVFFDEYSTSWSKDPEYNLLTLQTRQRYVNDLLRIRGHVFLNEVYQELGMPHTKAGAVVGWTLDGEGDGYIDFGVFDSENEKARDFVNGRNNSILLDFNVDGVILNKIDQGRIEEGKPWQS